MKKDLLPINNATIFDIYRPLVDSHGIEDTTQERQNNIYKDLFRTNPCVWC